MITRRRFSMNEEQIRWGLLLWSLFFALTSLFVFLLPMKRTGINEYNQVLTTRSMNELLQENNLLEQSLEELKGEIDDVYMRLDNTLTQEDFLREETQYYKLSSGATPVEGEGLIVLVTDSRDPLKKGQNPNTQLVHDVDINILLSELRGAGAEAIGVNGERVLINRTSLVCQGPTIRINERVYSQPFVIEAIGPRRDLLAAIYATDGYTQLLRRSGIFVEANTSIMLQLPAHTDEWAFTYLKEVHP